MQRSQLLEESVQIAWDYLERFGKIDDPTEASRFLKERIEAMISKGIISRLALSNKAITAYENRKNPDAAAKPTMILLVWLAAAVLFVATLRLTFGLDLSPGFFSEKCRPVNMAFFETHQLRAGSLLVATKASASERDADLGRL